MNASSTIPGALNARDERAADDDESQAGGEAVGRGRRATPTTTLEMSPSAPSLSPLLPAS